MGKREFDLDRMAGFTCYYNRRDMSVGQLFMPK